MADITGLNTPPSAGEAATKGYVDTLAGGGGGGLPIGAIVPFVGTSAPTNTLLCDGTAVSRTTYATLFGIISTAYGAGDGSTTFNLPNFRTATRIPIGLDGGQAGITGLGNSGGAFNHTHTSTAHVHSFSHSHDLGSHTHTYDHSHTMGSHSHDMQSHTHDTTHAHNFPAHGHGTGGLSFSTAGHRHNLPERTGTGIGNAGAPRPSDGSGTLINFGTTNFGETLGVSGSIGLGGGSNGDGAFGMNNSNPGTGGPSDNGTSGPSTNSTTAATGSTGGPSNNNTDTFGGNTDSGGGGITTSTANPPYVTVNFVIQAL